MSEYEYEEYYEDEEGYVVEGNPQNYDPKQIRMPGDANVWGDTGRRWAQRPASADPLSKGEIRWGASTDFALDVGDGKMGVLIPQSAVPITISPVRTLTQTPNAPARIWELLLGIYWQNPNEGRQGPANGMTVHANFLVQYGVGSMVHKVVLEPGNGIDPTDDTVTQVETMGVNMFVHTFDVSEAFFGAGEPPASEIGSTLITSSAFNIDTYVWAENLPGAAFAPPARTLHLRAFCAIAPYNRGAKT